MDTVEDDEIDEVDNGLDHLDEDEGSVQSDKTKTPAQSEDWKTAIADLAKTVQKTQTTAPVQQRQPTQDEIDEYWSLWKPEKQNPAFAREFFNLPEDADPKVIEAAQKRFDDLRQGLTKQAVVGAQRLFQQELNKLRDELAPDREFISQAKADRTREKFFKTYPVFGDEDAEGNQIYSTVLTLAAKDLATQEFENEKQYFKALAERAAQVVKTVNPAFDLGAVKPKQTQGSTPRLPRTRAAGTGGAGGSTIIAGLMAKGDATDEFLNDD